MKVAYLLAGPLFLFAAAATAQPAPHEQHQSSGQHPATADQERCCCEEMMRKMMMEMMRKHQGKDAHSQRDAPPPSDEDTH